MDTLQVSAGKSQELQIYFLPFDLGDQNCSVIFHDPEVGEFMINVKGTGLIPAPVEQTSFIGTSGTPIEKVIRLSPSNSLRERAIHTCVNLNYSTGYNSASRSRSGSGRDKSKSFGERDSYQLPKQNLKYQVEYLSPFITGPNQVVIKAPPSSEKGKITTITEQLHSELPVTFSPPVILQFCDSFCFEFTLTLYLFRLLENTHAKYYLVVQTVWIIDFSLLIALPDLKDRKQTWNLKCKRCDLSHRTSL